MSPLSQCPASNIPRLPEPDHPSIHQAWLEWLLPWSTTIGTGDGVLFLIDTGSDPAFSHGLNTFLLTAAAAGFFLRSEPRPIELDSDPGGLSYIAWFVRKPYLIRPARITDLPDLQRLEQACWEPHLRAAPSELHQRILHFPAGQCVLMHAERLAGAVYSQRINSTDHLSAVTSHTALSLFSPTGPILQLLAVSILPEPSCQGLGDELLSFMLSYSYAMPGIDRVAAVSLCKDFVSDAGMSIQQYIFAKNHLGHCIDPILRFHESHGGHIRGVIANYRPEDRKNLGYGVLVDYGDPPRRFPEPSGHQSNERDIDGASEVLPASRTSISRRSTEPDADILRQVMACVQSLLPATADFRSDRPLRDLGFDSLKLMELGSLLGHRYNIPVEPGFFFEYVTVQDIAAFFTRRLSGHAETSHGHAAVQSQSHEDRVAVIGMACRFPSPAEDFYETNGLDAFWEVLENGRQAVRPLSDERWRLMNEPDAEQMPSAVQYGGQIPQVDAFDAAFFDISPREAKCMDPQQRILLETVWEALEHAALDPRKLSGTRCGVFIGLFGHDYAGLQTGRRSLADIDAYFGTGTSSAVAAGRISYFLGLNGPSLTIDTACSSSLVAIHQACESIRAGESDVAIAGGVNLILSTDMGLSFNRAGMLSEDGCCRTFDASANGYVRSDGCGVVILKSLQRAIEDGDPIQAVIRASVINQDGFSNGLTAPSLDAQKSLISDALIRSGLSPADVQYLETHGTGTPLGDAIEIQAIAGAYGRDSACRGEPVCSPPVPSPLIIGSVKTNIGHCEAAAGVAGLIKVILSLQHEIIPPHLHFKKPGQLIRLDSVPAVIATEPLPWKRNPNAPVWCEAVGAKELSPPPVSKRNSGGPLRCGAVSSFGFSGTNAHVILQEAPEVKRPESSRTVGGPCLLTLSAKTPAALSDLIRRYIVFFKTVSDADIADICHTTHLGRAHFPHRAAFVADSMVDVLRQLESGGTGSAMSKTTDPASEKAPPKIAFLFTGPGSEYPGMGRNLYLSEPLFRQHLDDCGRILDRIGHPGLIRGILSKSGTGQLTLPGAAKLFCIQYALFQLWQAWGISPAVVIGHSLGEFAAACAAGVLSLEEALILTTALDRSVACCPPGVMVSVLAGPDSVLPFLETDGGRVVVAAINSPRNTVIAGPADAIDRVCIALNHRDIQTLRITTAAAYHSPLMEPALAEWQSTIEKTGCAAPRIPVVSTHTGRLENERLLAPDYWMTLLREKVNFRDGINTLNAMGDFVFVEIGPQPTLLSLARQNLPAAKTHRLPSLRLVMDDRRQMRISLGKLYEIGADIRWEAVDRERMCKRVSVPTYPFQRQRYWFDVSPRSDRHRIASQTTLSSAPETPVEISDNPSLDHLFYGMTWKDCGELRPAVYPESAWLILADRQGVGKRLAQRLHDAGKPSVLVNMDAIAPDTAIRDEEWTTWIRHLRQGILDRIGSRNLTHIVYLWALDVPPPDHIDSGSLQKSLFQTVLAVPQILETLAGLVQAHHPRLWLATCGAMPVDAKQHDLEGPAGERTGLAIFQAPLWGIGRTAALEYPHLWGGLIDLDPVISNPDDPQIWGDALLGAIIQSGAEDLVAIRRNRMYATRLETAPTRSLQTIKKKDSLRFSPEATYLITGGLGALGLQTARWMSQSGARHIALVSRRKPSGSVMEVLQKLRESGVDLYIGSADVADPCAMARLFADVAAKMPPVKGVVHAAGVLDESLLSAMDMSHAMSVLSPKIQGAWVLHGLTQTFPLDFTVYYSSIAAVWGAKAQGVYAAANQFLDALSHHQHVAGRKVLSVNWGPWMGNGMAGQDSRTWLKRRGLTAIEPQDAFQALACLLETDAVQMTIADVDWPVFRRIYQSWGRRPLLDGMNGNGQRNGGAEADSSLPPVGEIRRRLADIPEFDRNDFLVTYLQTRTARVMGMVPDTAVFNPHQGFFSIGLDSIMAVELRQRIALDLDIDLPMTALFDYPNMTKLAVYMEEMIRDADRETVAPPMISADPPNMTGDAVASNFPSEIADLLNKELSELENLLRS